MRRLRLVLIDVGCAVAMLWMFTAPAHAQASNDDAALTATISALDTRVFDAYNQCDMATFESLFDPNVEFYHDNGGVTWNRADVVASTRRYICGKVTRRLLPETLRVYPIHDYGAIEEGEHVFCQSESGACEGIAQFVIVWRNVNGAWTITRVLSYGHRPLETPAAP